MSYVKGSYIGFTKKSDNSGRVRKFRWTDRGGNVRIGPPKQFVVHVAERFGFTPTDNDHIQMSNAMQAATGECIVKRDNFVISAEARFGALRVAIEAMVKDEIISRDDADQAIKFVSDRMKC